MKKYITLLFILITISAFAGKWTVYKIEDISSPKNDITAICFDKQGSLWIGTSYGVYKFIDEKWIAQGQENIYARTLFIDSNNVKWVGLTAGGLYKSDDGSKWTHIPEASKSSTVNVINSDSKGAIWVGDWNEGLFNLVKQADGRERWINYRAADEKIGDKEKIGDNSMLSIISDFKNRLWTGSYHGLSVFENNKWTFYNTQNSKLPDNNVYSLTADKNQNMWIGTGNGLVKIDESGWTIFNNQNSNLSCDLVLSLASDPKGNIWVGTNKGVFFFSGENWINYTTENSQLPDNRIQSIVFHENNIYIGTSHGLAIYEP
jgi:ligand-binding sensor domain-containing protein